MSKRKEIQNGIQLLKDTLYDLTILSVESDDIITDEIGEIELIIRRIEGKV